MVKSFIDKVRERAIGQEVLRSVTLGQQVVKIVYDNLIEMLGAEPAPLNLAAMPPAAILMVGLQGVKTTTKLAHRLQQRERKKVMMACLTSTGRRRVSNCACWASRMIFKPCPSPRARRSRPSPNGR